ncbi:hypothetical protein [Salibacter sp.]|uniref:hypothetical protein n=1 Tax=Salibacter sp. TaxID=2010995 RepID=UPI00286FBE58|nr:hypothetical protein [Salibacter sp.]MDR9487472.1 hypothetical protein [Salibacter sp.]
MLKNQTINLKVIEKVASVLGELNEEIIYVGGAVVSLYATDEGAEHPRPTKDIDISVQIGSYLEMNKFQEKLRKRKIYPSSQGGVLYRYSYDGIQIDFIPWESTSLGPTNSWLKPGFEYARNIEVGAESIKILPLPFYIATKWEAYKSRGKDPRMSHDLEDIIYVIDNNKNVIEHFDESDHEGVRMFLSKMSNEILSDSSRDEIIECHINPYTANERKRLVLDRLKYMSESNKKP